MGHLLRDLEHVEKYKSPGKNGAVRVGCYLGADIKPDPWGGWSDVDAVADEVVDRLRGALAARRESRLSGKAERERLAV